MTSRRNLCATVENRPRWETLRCTVTRQQAPPYQRFTTSYHEWPDHRGGITGCACIHCGKTLKEVRVRINPKTGQPVRRGSLAREIATTPADVPPVRFVNWTPLVSPTEGESNLMRAFRNLGVKPKLTPP